ncbi:MAG: MBL fold metallo-hydrolase [Clostridia bacterium]|nr:MBL fold metallo-hydrolase [Clostridia bacterium]
MKKLSKIILAVILSAVMIFPVGCAGAGKNITVVFKNYDGAVVDSNTYEVGEQVTPPQNPTKPSDDTYTYEFSGWVANGVENAGKVTYTASYNAIYRNYTVEFRNYDNSLILSTDYHYGDTIIEPTTVPTKPSDAQYDYEFIGWSDTVGMCNGNKTYTAQFGVAGEKNDIVVVAGNGACIIGETEQGETVTKLTASSPQCNFFINGLNEYNVGDTVHVEFYLKPVTASPNAYDDTKIVNGSTVVDYALKSGEYNRVNFDGTVVNNDGEKAVKVTLDKALPSKFYYVKSLVVNDDTFSLQGIFGGVNLIQYEPNSSTKTMMNGYVLTTPDGKIVVQDGGYTGDGAGLYQLLTSLGEKVDGWFLSHYHIDHITALTEILNTYDIKIDNLYYNFSDTWPNPTNDADRPCIAKLETAIANNRNKIGNIITTKKNDEYKFGKYLNIKVLNDPDYTTNINTGNNTTVVYKAETPGEDILFLGDLGESGDKFIQDASFVREIRTCRVIQMAHHGQAGVSDKFYKLIDDIKVCLYPAPEWLYDVILGAHNGVGVNAIGSGPWNTLHTRHLMRSLGVRYSFPAIKRVTLGGFAEGENVAKFVEVKETAYVGTSTYTKNGNAYTVSTTDKVEIDLSAYANQINGTPVRITDSIWGGKYTICEGSNNSKVVIPYAEFNGYPNHDFNIVFKSGEEVTEVSVSVYACDMLIKSAEDLDAFGAVASYLGNSAVTGVWSGHFVLCNDIEYNKEFKPFITRKHLFELFGGASWVESAKYGFNGIFDGQGHNINGLKLNCEASFTADNGYGTLYDEPQTSGFIGLLHNNGVIKNLSFTNGEVTSGTTQGDGFISYGGGGKIEQVYVHLKKVTNNAGMFGGIIGINSQAVLKIKNCFVQIDEITGTSANKVYTIGSVYQGYFENTRILDRVYGVGTTNAVNKLGSGSYNADIYGSYQTKTEMANANIEINSSNGWDMSIWTTDTNGCPVTKSAKLVLNK